LKQIPHAVGYDKDPEDDFSFSQADGENTFTELLQIFNYFSWGAIVVSTISLIVLMYWDKTKLKNIQLLPVSLFVVFLGIILNLIFKIYIPDLYIHESHLVNIPKFEGYQQLLLLPKFSEIGNHDVWIIAFTIAIVASLETLLNLEAVENIDPEKRLASPNVELIAQGTGNMLAGFVGGIPITSVIVRSSVNINAGSKTKLSSIFHGIFLLLSLLLLGPFLNLIPLASLASILLVTGYKLTKVELYKDMYSKGYNQFIPFISTILAIVFTDLLIGVLIGLGISIFYLLKSNFHNPFVIKKETLHLDEKIRIELPNQVSFLNKASIQETLWNIPENSKVIIDATNSDYIDSDVLDIINNYKNTVSGLKNIKVNVLGIKSLYHAEDRIEFVDVLDKETQERMSPEDILEILKNGNERFVKGNWAEKYLKQQVNATSFGQNPFAIVLSCIDSRTTTEHIFDLGLGDIFSVRIAGNILNEDILGSMEFGIHEIGVKLIVVLGHTKCGAIIGACNHVKLGNLTTLLNKIQPAIDSETTFTLDRNGSNLDFVNKVSEQNVLLTIERIKNESSLIADLEAAGKIKIVGALYDVETGIVSFY
jgi:MFS superfamily sulfate permease-like transporter